MPDQLNYAFSALADPTRRAILARLANGDASVSQLTEPFAITMPAITKHLKVLERAGLISRTRLAQSRPCHLEPAGFKAIADWLEFYRNFWDQSFDRMDSYLKTLQRPTKGRKKK
jgi:DNA-binding transcriptional ArsR family regulator